MNMVSGAEYGPRVGCGEHGEWCRVWSMDGRLLTWCMHFIKLGNSGPLELLLIFHFLCCA